MALPSHPPAWPPQGPITESKAGSFSAVLRQSPPARSTLCPRPRSPVPAPFVLQLEDALAAALTTIATLAAKSDLDALNTALGLKADAALLANYVLLSDYNTDKAAFQVRGGGQCEQVVHLRRLVPLGHGSVQRSLTAQCGPA